MNTFVIDRSTTSTHAACYAEGNVPPLMCCTTAPVAHTNDRTPQWVADLNNAFIAEKCSPDTIDTYVVGLGPGSFSGIRAGIACIQGMALIAEKPVYGVSSAAVIAWQYFCENPTNQAVTVIGDARRDTIWVCNFIRQDNKILRSDGAPLTHTKADFTCLPLKDAIANIPTGNITLTVDYLRLLGKIPALKAATPSAEYIYTLWRTIQETATTDPLPIYLHPAVMPQCGKN